MTTKLNAAGEAGSTANARTQSITRFMGLFGEKSGTVPGRPTALAEATELQISAGKPFLLRLTIA